MGCNDRRKGMQNNNMKFCWSCSPLTHWVHPWFCICLALVLCGLAFVSYSAAFHDFWPLIGSHWKAPPPILWCSIPTLAMPIPPWCFTQSLLTSSSKVLVYHKQVWGHIPSSVAGSEGLCVPYFCVTLPCSRLCTKPSPKTHCYKKCMAFYPTTGKIRKIQTDGTCVK